MCETVADAAYGDGDTRRQLAEAKRTLIAKVPQPPRSPFCIKQDFHIDLEARRGTCPAGEVTTHRHYQRRDRQGHGQQVPRQALAFAAAVCDGCRLQPPCVKAAPRHPDDWQAYVLIVNDAAQGIKFPFDAMATSCLCTWPIRKPNPYTVIRASSLWYTTGFWRSSFNSSPMSYAATCSSVRMF